MNTHIRRHTRRPSASPRFSGVRAALLLSVLYALGAPGDAEAQALHRYAAGWTVGAGHVTELNPNAPTALEPGTGAVAALHIDRWLGDGRRLGLRYQVGYQRPRFDWAQGERKVHAASADLSLLLRPLSPADDPLLLPFLGAGFGGTWYDLGRGPATTFTPADARHDGESRILPTGVFAAGVDIRTPARWDRYMMKIRLEVADHISLDSPLHRASDGDRYGAVHHWRFAIGAHTVFSY